MITDEQLRKLINAEIKLFISENRKEIVKRAEKKLRELRKKDGA